MYTSRWTSVAGIGLASALIMLASSMAAASQDGQGIQQIHMDLGDYKFHPDKISIVAGTSAELILTNRDSFTPHNFIVEAPEAGMQFNVDVPNGTSVKVVLHPTRPGTYAFYCDEQFLFFENHREKGMEGEIEVAAASG
jgi:plastocyanin